MTDTEIRADFPVDGRGQRVSDIKFLLSCVNYLTEHSLEKLDPEDLLVLEAIKLEAWGNT